MRHYRIGFTMTSGRWRSNGGRRFDAAESVIDFGAGTFRTQRGAQRHADRLNRTDQFARAGVVRHYVTH